MPIRSYSMPLRSYFLVIGPALAGSLWWMSSYLEPTPAVPVRPALAAQPAKAETAPVGAALPVQRAATTGQASPQPPRAPTTEQAAPQPLPAASDTAKSAEATTASDVTATTKRQARVTAKAKKRKHVAQRRLRRDSPGDRGRYAAYDTPYPSYYPAPQPFYGYRTW